MTLVFIKRDESRFVLVIEVGELVAFRGAKLSDPCKKSKAQILRADVSQKIWVQGGIFRPRLAYEDALAAADRLRQFAHGVSTPIWGMSYDRSRSPAGLVAAPSLRFGLCDIGPHQFAGVSSPHTFGHCGRS